MKEVARYFDPELSWLAFNERVLAQSNSKYYPLLERLNLIAISAKNLDEFYMVRIAELRKKQSMGIKVTKHLGLSYNEVFGLINERTHKLLQDQIKQLNRLLKELKAEGICIVDPKALTKFEIKWLKEYFAHNVLPTLTPLALDPAHPFPFIPNKGLTITLELVSKDKKEMKALIPLANQLQRFIPLPGKSSRFILAEDLIHLCIEEIFPDFTLKSHGCFRILRHSEINYDIGNDDYIEHFEIALKNRKRNAVVLLTIDSDMPEPLRKFIIKNLNLESGNVLTVDGILGLDNLDQFLSIDKSDLKFPVFTERFPERIREFGGNIFDAVAHKDLVVHHPYESFDVVAQFFMQAAKDPNVVSIKLTLYRTSKNSPIIASLIEAAENGKSVIAVVEIQAELDEQNNLQWAHELERAGVMVIYGIYGYITHGKMSQVTRREEGELKMYTHLATGNYHPYTAQVYDDLSLFTAESEMGEEVSKVFNYITGYAQPKNLKKISYAPVTLRQSLEELIQNEIDFAKKGLPAAIWLKMNSIGDEKIINLLYEASCAGVSIDLIVRGICCLCPGVKGLSENIRVKSIIGRFLEHSRILCFGNGAPLPSPKAKVFISSANWDRRNIERRFDTLVPIENQTVREQVMNQIMIAFLKDEAQSWGLDTTGKYSPFREIGVGFSAQDYFMNNPSLSGRGDVDYSGIPKLTLKKD